MGVLFGYYAATDDHDAARAIVREDGEPVGTGYDEVVVKGVDPVVALLPAEALLTGRPAAAVKADRRRGHLVAMVGEGEVVGLALTDCLRDCLVGRDAASLAAVARDWSASDAFDTPPDPDGLAEFLGDLAALATRAAARGRRLYCWICP
ncbi:hypothetical protein [Streptomyces sp. URMC 123]|uniref:hypothetical protein n=1 Tax=Streptomyces sp. URMC 123 TaxID=3423403 RepID=UPI003F1A143F